LIDLSCHILKIDAAGSVERRQNSGTKRIYTVSTRENIESVSRTGSQPRKSAGYTSTSAWNQKRSRLT